MSTDVTLTGRLTRDPDLKFSQAGKAVTRFAVVTSRRVKDQKTGEWSDADTTFWDCVAFGELTSSHVYDIELAEGSDGHASQEEWTTKDGEKRRSMKVVAEDVAPSLRWASAKVAKAARQQSDAPSTAARDENPFNSEPPF